MNDASLRIGAEASRSSNFWLETCGDDMSLRPALSGDVTVDVAILGGGFSGLWTAYHLLRGDPSLEIAIVERAFCGFGASGRNGGWCSPRFPVDVGALVKRVGPQRARDTIGAQKQAVRDIGQLCEEEGIDAHYRANGLLSVARGEAQLADLKATFRTYERLGLSQDNRLLDADETFERVHISKLTGGMETRAGASIHPGRLVRGLARAVERRGATIYEGSPAVRIAPGGRPAIVTETGTVRARRAVVAAAEAYLTGLPAFHRALMPMSSMIVMSSPLSEAQWREIGWAGGESLSSQAHTKDYLTRTQDGRILYGSRGAPYLYGSRMPEAALCDEETFAWMRDTVREWWPVLRDVDFPHQWGGFLGVPRDWMPTVSFDPSAGLGQLHGYAGRGVTTSFLSARLLAGLIGGWATGLEDLPLHRQHTPRWEIEPFRWMGVRYVQNAFARIDDANHASAPKPWDASFARYLGEP